MASQADEVQIEVETEFRGPSILYIQAHFVCAHSLFIQLSCIFTTSDIRCERAVLA